MKNKTIFYKDHEIVFSNILEQGWNIDKRILDGTLYSREDHTYESILPLLNTGDVVYDIGAYIGTYAIPMSLEGMKVVAFEGFPDNYTRLNVNTLPYDNISTHCVAVSNEKKSSFTQFNDCTNMPPEARDISYVILDDYIKENNLSLPNFVKLDIEGMETVALLGMTNLLEKVRPVWQIGYHKGIDITFDEYPGFVETKDGGFDFSIFNELDYYIFNLIGDRVNEFSVGGEYLCVPKEKITI